jgi:threonine aldolase
MSHDPIDLRSDTVTRPTPAMREAMASAAVGDDQFSEDPTVNALQDRVSALLGKERALWMPTGTMANQVALRVLTRPGDHVIVSRESHASWHETGGAAANAGVQLSEIGSRGVFTADEFLAARNPRGHMLLPPTTVVEIENTHNRSGGVVFPQDEAVRVCDAARADGVASYLDGARLWNACVASGRMPSELAAPFDLVSVAFSKGLGAPGGSMLAGARPLIDLAVRHRRMLGGAMRQAGIFAAAANHGLDHHMGRLTEDHANAALIARRLSVCRAVVLDPSAVQTNIVVFGLTDQAPDAPTVVARAHERGVLAIAFGRRTIRLVTHLDVSRAQCERAADVLADVMA